MACSYSSSARAASSSSSGSTQRSSSPPRRPRRRVAAPVGRRSPTRVVVRIHHLEHVFEFTASLLTLSNRKRLIHKGNSVGPADTLKLWTTSALAPRVPAGLSHGPAIQVQRQRSSRTAQIARRRPPQCHDRCRPARRPGGRRSSWPGGEPGHTKSARRTSRFAPALPGARRQPDDPDGHPWSNHWLGATGPASTGSPCSTPLTAGARRPGGRAGPTCSAASTPRGRAALRADRRLLADYARRGLRVSGVDLRFQTVSVVRRDARIGETARRRPAWTGRRPGPDRPPPTSAARPAHSPSHRPGAGRAGLADRQGCPRLALGQRRAELAVEIRLDELEASLLESRRSDLAAVEQLSRQLAQRCLQRE